MAAANSHCGREDWTRLGPEAFARHVRPKLQAEDDGEFVAVDIATGDLEIDEDDYTAVTRLRNRRWVPTPYYVQEKSREAAKKHKLRVFAPSRAKTRIRFVVIWGSYFSSSSNAERTICGRFGRRLKMITMVQRWHGLIALLATVLLCGLGFAEEPQLPRLNVVLHTAADVAPPTGVQERLTAVADYTERFLVQGLKKWGYPPARERLFDRGKDGNVRLFHVAGRRCMAEVNAHAALIPAEVQSDRHAHSVIVADDAPPTQVEYWRKTYTARVTPDGEFEVVVDDPSGADRTLRILFCFDNGAVTGDGKQQGLEGAIVRKYRFMHGGYRFDEPAANSPAD